MKKSLFAIVFLFLAAPALAEPSAFVAIVPQKYFVDHHQQNKQHYLQHHQHSKHEKQLSLGRK